MERVIYYFLLECNGDWHGIQSTLALCFSGSEQVPPTLPGIERMSK